jgi:hypothetical protein
VNDTPRIPTKTKSSHTQHTIKQQQAQSNADNTNEYHAHIHKERQQSVTADLQETS